MDPISENLDKTVHVTFSRHVGRCVSHVKSHKVIGRCYIEIVHLPFGTASYDWAMHLTKGVGCYRDTSLSPHVFQFKDSPIISLRRRETVGQSVKDIIQIPQSRPFKDWPNKSISLRRMSQRPQGIGILNRIETDSRTWIPPLRSFKA